MRSKGTQKEHHKATPIGAQSWAKTSSADPRRRNATTIPRRSTRHRPQKTHGRYLNTTFANCASARGNSLNGTKIEKQKQKSTTRKSETAKSGQRRPGMDEIQGRARKGTAEDISTQQNTSTPGGTIMGNRTRRMGRRTGKYQIEYAYNERTKLQKEIGRRSQKIRRQIPPNVGLI